VLSLVLEGATIMLLGFYAASSLVVPRSPQPTGIT
jgi:hypothetical protein